MKTEQLNLNRFEYDLEDSRKCAASKTTKSSEDEGVCLSPFSDPLKMPISKELKSNRKKNIVDDDIHGLYEIYTAGFETKVTYEQITEYIMKSDKIGIANLFHVKMLGGTLNRQ